MPASSLLPSCSPGACKTEGKASNTRSAESRDRALRRLRSASSAAGSSRQPRRARAERRRGANRSWQLRKGSSPGAAGLRCHAGRPAAEGSLGRGGALTHKGADPVIKRKQSLRRRARGREKSGVGLPACPRGLVSCPLGRRSLGEDSYFWSDFFNGNKIIGELAALGVCVLLIGFPASQLLFSLAARGPWQRKSDAFCEDVVGVHGA